MNPDRSNFEIWLLEWLDGTLTGQQAEKFRIFLEENPDLKDDAEFLSQSRLCPGNKSFPGKSLLKKSAADLSSAQVEYLSIAYLENDLSPDQREDLQQSIEQNSESKALFDSLQKIRLIPPTSRYKHKNRLRKPAPGAVLLRISYIGLSAAATIALIILSITFLPHFSPSSENLSDLNSFTSGEPFEVSAHVLKGPEEEITIRENIKHHVAGNIPVILSQIKNERDNLTTAPDSSPAIFKKTVSVFRIDSLPDFNIDLNEQLSNHLLAASSINIKDELLADERNRLSRFITRIFREKILNDNTGSDTPLKPYEIAAAGIDGISRLFGFEMALVGVTDVGGDLKSIYFSSRILKFNAPVRKSNSAE
jgi:hypothetical protein